MKANTNQQILKLLYKNWKSFFNSVKDWKIHKNKYSGKPKLPKYKDKLKGRNIVVFSCSNKTNIKNGYFYFPKFTNLKPIKTKVTRNNLCQARIVPQKSCFVFEIIYKIDVSDRIELNNNYISIDLGINNFATCLDNSLNTFIVNGKIIKSFNQFYNKTKSKYQSILKKVNNKYMSKRLYRLEQKRKNKINDFMHKASRFIINYCIQNNINNLIVGHNKNWKQGLNIGRVNNQKFIQIPFNIFIHQLKYKCENEGINFIMIEESYTSKVDHLVFEEMNYHAQYLGKRIKRGLFKSSNGKVINADVNGALGILRKVIDESYFKKIVNRGTVNVPNKINVLKR